jgi:prepilin peptidase CpaA
MTALGGLVFMVVTFPILLWCAWTDLKFMRIPNRSNLLLFAIFVVLGAFFMPLPEFGFRLLQGVVVLVFFFVLNSMGLIGGGDAKLFAAIAPYVAFADLPSYLLMLSILTLAAVAAHRFVMYIPALRKQVTGWVSWDGKGKFPFGFPLAMSLTLYLFIVATTNA